MWHMNSTLAKLDASDSRATTNLQPLTILRDVDLICHLWQQYVNVALFPLANNSVTVRREMTVFNNQTISRIEGLANQVMQKVTDGLSYPSYVGSIANAVYISDCDLSLRAAGETEANRLQAQR
jgi:hypothetical protein